MTEIVEHCELRQRPRTVLQPSCRFRSRYRERFGLSQRQLMTTVMALSCYIQRHHQCCIRLVGKPTSDPTKRLG
jgi:hypothetical protein